MASYGDFKAGSYVQAKNGRDGDGTLMCCDLYFKNLNGTPLGAALAGMLDGDEFDFIISKFTKFFVEMAHIEPMNEAPVGGGEVVVQAGAVGHNAAYANDATSGTYGALRTKQKAKAQRNMDKISTNASGQFVKDTPTYTNEQWLKTVMKVSTKQFKKWVDLGFIVHGHNQAQTANAYYPYSQVADCVDGNGTSASAY